MPKTLDELLYEIAAEDGSPEAYSIANEVPTEQRNEILKRWNAGHFDDLPNANSLTRLQMIVDSIQNEIESKGTEMPEQFNVEEALARLVAQVVAMPPEARADYLKNEWGLDDNEVASLLEDVADVEAADSASDVNVVAEGVKSGNISDSLDRIASDQDAELEEKAAKMAEDDDTDVKVTETDKDSDGDTDKAEIKKEKPEDDSKNSEAEDKPHDEEAAEEGPTDEEIDKAYAKANDNKTNQFARHLGVIKY